MTISYLFLAGILIFGLLALYSDYEHKVSGEVSDALMVARALCIGCTYFCIVAFIVEILAP